jgi:hypothetical protein
MAGSGEDAGGDAGPPRAGEGDDEVRRSTASTLVVVAVSISCRWAARVWSKPANAAAIERAIPTA